MLFRYQVALPTLANGQVGDAQLDVNGRQLVTSAGEVAAGAADSGNPVKVGGKYNATLPTLTDGQRGDLQLSSRGSTRVLMQVNSTAATDGVSNSSTGYAGNEGTATNGALMLVGTYFFNGTSWDRAAKANATSRIPSSAATTNATSAKASAGTVYTVEAMNTTASVKYLKLYNKASAPVVGTDTPVRTIALPPSNARMFIEFPTGLYFSAGIAYGMSGAAADADATALAAGDVVGTNIDYS